MKNFISIALYVSLLAFNISFADSSLPFIVVDTCQTVAYGQNGRPTDSIKTDDPLYGQDAHYKSAMPAYKDNGDQTITDLNTGLMWIAEPGAKRTSIECSAQASRCRIGGYDDWRLPSIKELYSLINFSGTDPDPRSANPRQLKPFIDSEYFKFSYGREDEGDRIIDSQFATKTLYRSTTMHGMKTMFGVNFADGRIKGYPAGPGGPRGEKKYYALYVRENPAYGKNEFKDNGNGTVTDLATGLMWMKVDSGHLKAGSKKDGKLNWPQALNWSQTLEYAGYSDWRLPNAKELQSIVDYSRCPDATNSAAIDPIFDVTSIINEGGKKDYPFYWTSTSHCRGQDARAAVYIAFGRGLGWMQDPRTNRMQLMDVHGAGCQRSDPKTGNPNEFPYGRGPQGDVVRTYNYVRCVRGPQAGQ